ncbi:MAG: type IV pilus twitching motility protein PilT [Mobilitalea sp.]
MSIDELLIKAKSMGASDLHITVGVSPTCRVNGELITMDYDVLKPADTEELLDPMFNERTKEIFLQKGEMDLSYAINGVGRYRVNIFRQRGSYAGVIRLVVSNIPKPSDLLIPASVVELTKKKRGLVLVTGPTGSGKSTTLASLIDVINHNYNSHVITLEDPIEYLYAHHKSIVNQREIGLDSMNFSTAIRSAMREDPDVILVGEMRDLDTIATAITAAETGHLVFSTLHTVGAAYTIDRIIDVFPPHQQQQIRIQLSSVLEAVVSQQLIPTIDGKGRVAAFEVMHATPAVKNLIRESKTHQINSIIQISKKLGMQTMDDAIMDLFLRGIISAEKAVNFAQDSAFMEKKTF